MSDSLQPHGLQHIRLPCPPLPPGVCANSCPLSQPYYLTISSSAIPFSFCLPSFLASRSFSIIQSYFFLEERFIFMISYFAFSKWRVGIVLFFFTPRLFFGDRVLGFAQLVGLTFCFKSLFGEHGFIGQKELCFSRGCFHHVESVFH